MSFYNTALTKDIFSLLFSLDFSQHEKIKADRLYNEVHAFVTVQFVDEKRKGLTFLAYELHVFFLFIYGEYKKVFSYFL